MNKQKQWTSKPVIIILLLIYSNKEWYMCVYGFSFVFFCFFLVDYFLLAILYIITLPQIVFFNFPFFFFLLGQLFVCFDFLCTPCSLSVTHYFFFYCSLSTIRGSACGSSILNFFFSFCLSFFLAWLGEPGFVATYLSTSTNSIYEPSPPLYTFSNISLPLFNYNYHYLLFLQSLNLGSIHNYLRPAFFMYSI